MSSSVQPHSASPIVTDASNDAISHAFAHRSLRSVALLLARHEIRNLRRWFEEFDRDILLPILLGEIALHNIGAFDTGGGRGGDGEDKGGRPRQAAVEAVPTALDLDCAMKPCNAYSIAAATGLPRETVRRKIVRLVELGWISRQDNGHLFVSREALAHFGRLLSSRELSELLETADRARALLDTSEAP
ncbi:MAG TPA: hypothetical protein PLF79_12050 [Thauera sp.]|uniref:hypothetical protein n=1 Tax=Thauera sp. TaxID=1905334 RepID=UPI002B63F7A0|nr:hypothetical protein [Thauera sp.]HRP24269.1 hypothetical protein [Thauera sp.]HRP66801.1 hypothetical protein [Thauera sp.]